ncbi:MAG: PEP/pyruvate-binding domain-containing protein [Gemmataceae bacterium]
MIDNDNSAPWIYFFGNGQADGSNDIRHLVGGKGASLAEMTKAGLRVPPGFTISTECCRLYREHNQTWPEGLREQVRFHIGRLQAMIDRRFGEGDNPLLVAVRSGAETSMPGMMDTILNVGLNPECVKLIGERIQNPRAAWWAYRDFLVTFGKTVGGIPEHTYAAVLSGLLEESGLTSEDELDDSGIETLCERFRQTYQHRTNEEMPTEPFKMLFLAIAAVFRSWNNERAIAYREHHNITGLHGTAVTVQVMCPSEVSGVMFTKHPVNPDVPQMVIEAAYGLGEAVVLGQVTPDRFYISRDQMDPEIIERHIVEKPLIMPSPLAGDVQRIALDPSSPTLTDEQLHELIQLGLKVEAYFHEPCDIEWGFAGGEFYLLQSRPIRYHKLAEDEALEHVRKEEIERLQKLADPRGTVWSRYNLAEILPAPTPMTWSIVQEFMSGTGGFGRMYRDFGFDPAPILDDLGIFDLVCGRPYCNLSREPLMLFKALPFEHPFAELKEDPQKALYPEARFNPARASWKLWAFFPIIFYKVMRNAVKLRWYLQTFVRRFRERIVPPFVEEAKKEIDKPLDLVDSRKLFERLKFWIQRTLYDFARHSLKPAALADLSMRELERILARIGTERSQAELAGATNVQATMRKAVPRLKEMQQHAREKLRKMVMGVKPEPVADLAGGMEAFLQGRLDQEQFLEQFGHRGQLEMELANPRWLETPELLEELRDAAMYHQAQQKLATSTEGRAEAAPSEEGKQEDAPNFSPLDEYDLQPRQRRVIEQALQNLRTNLSLRETAKHHLMRGYALIRKYLVELDTRYRLDGGLFYLEFRELPELLKGHDFTDVINERRRRRDLLLKLYVPQVLFSDNLGAIGRPEEAFPTDTLQGIPLSAGVAEGPALVLDEPSTSVPIGEPFILVCPTTDPAWTPLFSQAQGLIMETGGMLSHGAILAREFGLPAVACLPEIHKQLTTGQRLHVDGSTGKVSLLE